MFTRYIPLLCLSFAFPATVRAEAPAPAPLAPLTWTTTGPLISPIADASHPIVSVKDPTVVYSDGLWHVYATTYAEKKGWSMVYLNFRNWSEAAQAKPYYLDRNPALAG